MVIYLGRVSRDMDLYLKLQGSMQRCITIICPPAAVAVLKGAWVHGYLFNKKSCTRVPVGGFIWAGAFGARVRSRDF